MPFIISLILWLVDSEIWSFTVRLTAVDSPVVLYQGLCSKHCPVQGVVFLPISVCTLGTVLYQDMYSKHCPVPGLVL